MFNVIVLVDEEEEEDADIVIAKKVEDYYPKNKFSDRYEQSTSSESSCINPFTPGIGVQVISPWHDISFISNRKVKGAVKKINTRILCDHLIKHPILNITARATHPLHLRHPTHRTTVINILLLSRERAFIAEYFTLLASLEYNVQEMHRVQQLANDLVDITVSVKQILFSKE